MSNFMQFLLALALCCVMFMSGFTMGAGSIQRVPPVIQVQLPTGAIKLQHEGIQGDRKECLEWASANFQPATVGVLQMLCGGK